MFKEIAGMASLMKQAQKLSDRMESVSRELKSKRVVGAAGGGMVEVEMDGLGECLAVKIDSMLVEGGEREMIEDLLPAAINQAMNKAKEHHASAMKALTADLPVSGLGSSISKMIAKMQGEVSVEDRSEAADDFEAVDVDDAADDAFSSTFEIDDDDDESDGKKKKKRD